MASSSKRKTTRAKLDRERRLIERRLDKQARKEARKQQPPEQMDEEAVADAEIPASPDA